MSLLNLPNELLLYIADSLDGAKDIYSLLLASHRLVLLLAGKLRDLALQEGTYAHCTSSFLGCSERRRRYNQMVVREWIKSPSDGRGWCSLVSRPPDTFCTREVQYRNTQSSTQYGAQPYTRIRWPSNVETLPNSDRRPSQSS